MKRFVKLSPGVYELAIAQARIDEDSEKIHMFVSDEDVSAVSNIIVADGALDPPSKLLETGEVAT